MGKTAKPVVIGIVTALAVGFLMGGLRAAAGADIGIMPAVWGAMAGVFAAYIAGNLAGNRKTEKASDELRAQALALRPEPGSVLLVVYRKGFLGKAAGMNLSLDGRPFGQLRSPQFTAIQIPPGAHELTAGFGGLAGPQNNDGKGAFEAADGEAVVYCARVSMGAVRNTVTLERLHEGPDFIRDELRSSTMVRPEI